MYVLKNKKFKEIYFDKFYKAYLIKIEDEYDSFITFTPEDIEGNYIRSIYHDGTDYNGYEYVPYQYRLKIKRNNGVIYIIGEED